MEISESPSILAFFLDRDGVLIREVNYLACEEQVEVLPTVESALIDIHRAGYAPFVITNQSGVAKGYFELETIDRVHGRIEDTLGDLGRALEFFACPHHPDGTIAPYNRACGCRKPAPGLIHAISSKYQVDLRKSFVIGDKTCDLQAGSFLGCSSVLVRTGHGKEHEQRVRDQSANLNLLGIADDLASAVALCLAGQRRDNVNRQRQAFKQSIEGSRQRTIFPCC